MEDIYSIYEETLTAIGDALRRRFGETKMETVQGYLPLKAISKTSNVVDLENWTEGYPNTSRAYDVVSIPGATSIGVNLYYETEGISWDYVQVASGALNSTNFPANAEKFGGNATNIPYYEKYLRFDNTDTITFYFQTDGSGNKFLGYYAECIGYDADGNVILSEELGEWEEEVPNVYGPLEMPQAIDDIPVGLMPPEEALKLSGSIGGMFKNGTWDWFIETMGDQITTEGIYGENIFEGSHLEYIPFVLNKINDGYNTNSQWFYNCKQLKELPDITGQFGNSYLFCGNCYCIQRVPDSWVDIDYSYVNKSTAWYNVRHSSFFSGCWSLRYIPENFLKKIWCKVSSSGYIHDSMFQYCYSLDEIVGLRGNDATITGNQFGSTFNYTTRLKRLVFDMDNGSPRVQNWSNQTIDLTTYVGYVSDTSYILNYNSGIPANKRITDDATYLEYRDDPDCFTTDINYSRYNRISAVETINSLPDCSSSGGTNTIKFKGASGAKTTGGAINTMTAEEIAVATAKGWTVSFA